MKDFIDVLVLSLGIPMIQGLLLLSTCILVYGLARIVSARMNGKGGGGHLSRLGISLVSSWCILSLGVFLLLQRVEFDDIGTTYAPGYEKKKFEEIKLGDSRDYVERLLVPPLEASLHPHECWVYKTKNISCYFFYYVVLVVNNVDGTVQHIQGSDREKEVRSLYGSPDDIRTQNLVLLMYSERDGARQTAFMSSFQIRWIYFDSVTDIVVYIINETSIDFL
jgi:hypothetical protein